MSAAGSLAARRLASALLLVMVVFFANPEAHALVCQSTGNASWDADSTWSCGRVPFSTDDVEIANGDDVTIPAGFAAVAQSVTILSDNGTGRLIHAGATSTLTVGAGGFTTNAPLNDNINVWQINAGSAIVNGPVKLVEGTSNVRISRIQVSTGSLVINGGLEMQNASNELRTDIRFTGAGYISLAGSFTLTGGFGTLVGSGGTFDFNGSAAAQSIPVGASKLVFGNLHVNNTHPGGATLAAAVAVSGVGGNLRVQSGTLNNGGFAIVGAVARTFEVANGARFNLTGMSALPTGYGTRTFGATSTVNYRGGNQTVATVTYGHLILDNGSTKTPAAGTTTVAGNFTLGAGTTFAGGTNNPSYILTGNFTNGGTFSSGTGTHTFNGNDAVMPQLLTGATSYTNLTANNTGAGLLLANDVTVTTASTGTLTLTAGKVETQANSLIVTRACNATSPAPIQRTAGWVFGNLRKSFPAGSPACDFEVGDAVRYAPLSVTLASVATAGTLTARTTAGDQPNITSSTLNPAKSVNRYWTLANGGVDFSADAANAITFNFNNPEDVDPGADPASFFVSRYAASVWTEATPSARTSASTTISGVGITAASINGDYQIAERLQVAQIYYIHADHLNTPRLITNQAQQAVWRWDQAEPFGDNAPDENPSALGAFEFNLRFPGQYFDKETNLHYNYFRDCYDPAIGRFCQPDPIGLAGGINTYAYAYDPLTQTDPLGLMGQGSGTGRGTPIWGKGGPQPLCSCPTPPLAPSQQCLADNIDIAKDYSVWNPGSWLGLYANVGNYGPWDYKRQGSQYTDFGNFNFGAVTATMGIPGYVAQNSAGIYQQWKGAAGAGRGIPIFVWPYGDDPADAVQIDLGRRYSSCRCR